MYLIENTNFRASLRAHHSGNEHTNKELQTMIIWRRRRRRKKKKKRREKKGWRRKGKEKEKEEEGEGGGEGGGGEFEKGENMCFPSNASG